MLDSLAVVRVGCKQTEEINSRMQQKSNRKGDRVISNHRVRVLKLNWKKRTRNTAPGAGMGGRHGYIYGRAARMTAWPRAVDAVSGAMASEWHLP